MNQKVTRFVFSLFLIFTLIFIFYHSFGSFKRQYKTEMVIYSKASDIIHSDGFVIRNEHLIKSDEKGVMVFSSSNGTKVAKGSTLVEFFDSSDDVALKKQIDTLQEKITTLEDINKQNNIYAPNIDAISSQMKDILNEIISDIENNSFKFIDKNTEKFLYLYCQNQLATKRVADFSDIIKEYKSQLSKLKQQYKRSSKTIKSSMAGYFVNKIDGYESCLNYNKVNEITVDDLNKITPQQVSQNSIGKIIKGHKWYIATTVDINDARIFVKGKTFKIFLPLATADELNATVECVNKDFTSQKAVVVFAFTNMNEELSQIRKQAIQIVVNEFNGLKVNSKAVRVVDGKKGVYVKLGNIIKFREIDIIYSTKDFVIAKLENKKDKLKIYDDVYIEGKNLGGV